MAFYRVCAYCGATLDPGEICDCRNKEKAAPDAANIQSGPKVESESPSPHSTSHFNE